MKEKKPKRTVKIAIDLKNFREISSDELLRLSTEEYHMIRRAATKARNNHRDTRYACKMCGHALYAPNIQQKPLWKHYKGAPPDCPWHTENPLDIDAVSAQQFSGRQESPLHFHLKHKIADLLSIDPLTERGSIRVEGSIAFGDERRTPDVFALYDSHPTVIEIQLARSQIPIIIQREDFYEKAKHRLIWVRSNFQAPQHHPTMTTADADIFFSQNKCIFSIDDESIAASHANNTLILKTFWIDGSSWKSKLVSLMDLNWPANGRGHYVEPWHIKFRQNWMMHSSPEGMKFEYRNALLSEIKIFMTKNNGYSDEIDTRDIESLINCLMSIKEGYPIGTRQGNLVETINTFLNVERRHRFARILKGFIKRTNKEALLTTPSVERKFAAAEHSPQDDPETINGKIVLAIFPDIFGKV